MRIALGIEYHGHEFYGWQAQENLPTVQGHLEAALSKIANEPIQVFCAGRTDAGVHATGQVVHFNTQAQRDLRAWTIGVNTCLPPAIAVRWVRVVDDTFHARYSAISRRYRYFIYNAPTRPGIFSALMTWQYVPLNEQAMQLAAEFLLGEHDFTSLRSSQCQAKTPTRTINKISVLREKTSVIIEVEANAFLHHMVRNIAGLLMEVGKGVRSPEWVQEVLLAKDRRLAAQTAAAAGLYLVKVGYPPQYLLPDPLNSVLFV